MGAYFMTVGGAVLLLVIAIEYGWPPVEMFDTLLRTEKSRRIARIAGWILTAGLLLMVGMRLWSAFRDMF